MEIVQPLISTHDLAAALAGPTPPVLLDVRFALGGPPGRSDYDAGHLPGAAYLDLDTDLAAPPGPAGRHPLPDPDTLEKALRRAGVTADRDVVVNDARDGSVAARLWWLLRWAGHQRVAILDGGFAAWQSEGRPVSTEPATPDPGDFTVQPGGMPVLDADAAAALARSGRLLDARAAERYRGDTEPVDPRPGHVPGAINAPFAAHVGEDGRWRSAAELRDRFTRLGVRDGDPVGAYCGSGVTACSVLVALQVAGFAADQLPALYVGSWSNWSADPDRPAALGDQPG